MSRIVVALKKKTPEEAVQFAKNCEGRIWGLKLNDMLRNDLSFIQDIKQYCNVMADAKVYEIPEDMENQVRQLVDVGSDIVTVHLTPMWKPPEDIIEKVVGVTVLTSFTSKLCAKMYRATVDEVISEMVVDAVMHNGYRWIVCSAVDLRYLAVKSMIQRYGVKAICPSIRLSGETVQNDDQVRKATPAEAVSMGAHLLVVGRPILQAEDPIAVIERINEEAGE